MRRCLFLAFLVLWGTAFSAGAVELADVGGLQPNVPNFVGYAPNKIVVKFDPQTLHGIDKAAMARGRTGIPALDQVGAQYGVQSLRPQFPGARKKIYKGKVVDLSGWHVVEFPGKADVLAIVKHYKAAPGVLDAQPVGIHKVNAEPNDYNYVNWPEQWHLQLIGAPNAWDIEKGNPEIIVAVMDTGVRYFHGDLGGNNISYDYHPYQGKEIAVPVHNPAVVQGNMWINPNPDSEKDDWIGWDFVHVQDNWPLMVCYPGEDCLDADNDPRDFQGHGTHCAGNVASMNNNSYSQASVAGGWGGGDGSFVPGAGNGVRVMSLRIGWRAIYGILFDVGLVDLEAAAEAFRYAADHGARIASCSWGSSDTGALGAAIEYFLGDDLDQSGIQRQRLIFKAAGNDSTETADFMCLNPDVICVAATDQNDCKANFSTYGGWVDISAPGVGIWSSWHNADDPGYPELNWNGWDWVTYPEGRDWIATMDGTSMSTPLAASVAALIWSRNPGWTADQVKQRLFDSADSSIYNNSCNSPFANKLGAGRIDAYRAVSGASAPTLVADFTYAASGLTVDFTDTSTSTGTISGRDWDFGDGNTSDQQNPTHTYAVGGGYEVSLTVTDQTPTSETVTKTINVTDVLSCEVSVVSLETGIYGTTGRGKDKRPAYFPTDIFVQGDEVIIKAKVENNSGLPVAGVTVTIFLDDVNNFSNWTGTLIEGQSDSDGIAEAKWKTASPKGRGEGTKTGDYTAKVTDVTTSDGLTGCGDGISIPFRVNPK